MLDQDLRRDLQIVAFLAFMPVLPWLWLTALETGGVDAIWTGEQQRTQAWLLAGIGAVAGLAVILAVALTIRKRARPPKALPALTIALLVEISAGIAWIILAYSPSH